MSEPVWAHAATAVFSTLATVGEEAVWNFGVKRAAVHGIVDLVRGPENRKSRRAAIDQFAVDAVLDIARDGVQAVFHSVGPSLGALAAFVTVVSCVPKPVEFICFAMRGGRREKASSHNGRRARNFSLPEKWLVLRPTGLRDS